MYISLNKHDDFMWRIPFALQIAPAMVLGVGVYFCPFSPRWLMMQDRESEALTVLQKIRFCSDSEISHELEWIKIELELERSRNSQSYSSLIRSSLLRRLILGIGIQIFQQLTGINSILYFISQVVPQTNIGSNNQYMVNGIISGCVNILVTIPTVLFIDRIGRRLILISGAIIMALSMLTAGSMLFTCECNQENKTANNTDVSCTNTIDPYKAVYPLYVFVAAFAFSWGPAIWVYCTELFPLSMRAKGTSILLATNWLANCILSSVIPLFFGIICFKGYIIFGGFCVIIGVLTFLFYPETKGIPLEKMHELFSRPLYAFRFSRTATRINDTSSDESTPILNQHHE